jgi:uncharacterized membrane protein
MAEMNGLKDGTRPDHIWSFRGYRLSAGEFNNAMIHFYRGEVTRSNVWRSRLDATTNWAVVSTGAALSFAFSDAGHSHIMIPLSTLLITLFCYIEARRYQYYELWAYRVRLMETDFFAAMLAPPFQPSETWATRLVDNLLHPKFTISFWEAFGRRFRRNYQFIFGLLAIAWFLKIYIHPWESPTLEVYLDRAAIGGISGPIVLTAGMVIYAILFGVGWLTAGLRKSQGEILTQLDLTSPLGFLQSAGDVLSGSRFAKREELAYVITSRKTGEQIAEQLMHRLGVGVTAVDAKGMYTGDDKSVLFVAVHPEQIPHLKNLVRDIDNRAFVIIHHADQVIGRGFHAPS